MYSSAEKDQQQLAIKQTVIDAYCGAPCRRMLTPRIAAAALLLECHVPALLLALALLPLLHPPPLRCAGAWHSNHLAPQLRDQLRRLLLHILQPAATCAGGWHSGWIVGTSTVKKRMTGEQVQV